jgi:hypothetical protein
MYIAQQPVVLQGDAGVLTDLSFQPVTNTAIIAGSVQSQVNAVVGQKAVYVAQPLRGAIIPLGGDQTVAASFSYKVPLPSVGNGQLCLQVQSEINGDSAPAMLDIQCGLDAGGSVLSVLQAPPSFQGFPDDASVTASTRFTWSTFHSGLYELDLISGPNPTATTPNVVVYTADTSATWPDLAARQVRFAPGTRYSCTVVGVGVFKSMDELVGDAGLAAPVIPELRRSSYGARSVTLAQP